MIWLIQTIFGPIRNNWINASNAPSDQAGLSDQLWTSAVDVICNSHVVLLKLGLSQRCENRRQEPQD